MPIETRSTARLPFDVPIIGFGASSLGGMPETYGYDVDVARAQATVEAILNAPRCFIDTSRNYGMGRSEARIGAVFRDLGGKPDHCILSTKLDRDFETDRFDADRARRSLEESLEALGVDRIDILHLHDPEHSRDLTEITAKGGALDMLFRLKEEGLAAAVGLAMGDLEMMQSILPDWEFDALISHNRFTLLNRSADAMFDAAHARGIAILNAAPYAGGMLAKGPGQFSRVTYQEATAEQVAHVQRIADICARHDIPMGAAALHFSMRDPRVTATICGVSKPERVAETLDWAACEIPQAAWDELMALPYETADPEANRVYSPG